MKWIFHYQLFLFDFDGILVNTEELHFKAYKKVLKDRGFVLNWDAKTYYRHAMFTATGLQEAIYKEFPDLYHREPRWDVLYLEKKRAYLEYLNTSGVALIRGVELLLNALEKTNIKRCVVTHSSKEQIDFICEKLPILKSISSWITREDYKEPKPSSECYEKAIALHATRGDRVIGFEDSPRGLQALLKTSATGIFISPYFDENDTSLIKNAMAKPFPHFGSFADLFKAFSS